MMFREGGEAMADEVKDKERDDKEKVKRLAKSLKGDFYRDEGDYKGALAAYKEAQDKTKLIELGEICLKWCEPKIAVPAYEAAEEKISEERLGQCGEKCLKAGRLHDGVYAYQSAKLISRVLPSYYIVYNVDRDLFRECGDAILARARGVIEEDEKILNDAAIAYKIAKRPDKLKKIGDIFQKQESLRDYAKKAGEFYEEAARLIIEMKED